MEWWKKMMSPVRRLCFHVSARVKDQRRQTGGGLLKLRDDIQTCGYEDVQVMWEILRKSETELTDQNSLKKRKQRLLWRFLKQDHSSAAA